MLHASRSRARYRRILIATVAALAVAASPVLAGPAAAALKKPSPTATSTVALDLSGEWKFAIGDDPAWSDPAFDDSAWEALQVPQTDGAPQFADYDGFGWYRLTFDLPADAAGNNLVASLGFLDDVDEAFLNGVKIGGSGSMPPNAESQWFEQRLYPVPADAPRYGGTNTLAVRLYDMSGGGGWYQGPVGIYSKDALRETVYGITGPLAKFTTANRVTRMLAKQAEALAAGDVDGYLDTLADDYFHDGRDRDRRERELREWIAESGTLTLVDAGVEVVASTDGRLIVDTNRTITGTRDGEPFAYQPTTQEFLTVDRHGSAELGNQSRFFRDYVESDLEGARREYVAYLPPSYLDDPERQYPVVYLLHGVNGGSREWEPRDFGTRLDELYTTGGLEESIVIMPDAASLWYVDNEGGTPWRSMFINELIPQVDTEYRTLDSRDYRGLSGVSMGGFGAYSIGLAYPDMFSTLASHMGALNLPPALVGVTSPGGPAGQSNAPIADVAARTSEQLSRYDFFFDACEFDDYAFDDAARTLDGILTAKGVEHEWAVYPEGRHNDDCWVPHLAESFGLHSDHVRAALTADVSGPVTTATFDTAARTVTLSASDPADVATIEYSLKRANGRFETYSTPIDIGKRATTVYYRAVDSIGNTSEVGQLEVPARGKGER